MLRFFFNPFVTEELENTSIVEQTNGTQSTDLCFPCRTMRQAQRDLRYRPLHHRINNPSLPSTNVVYPARICSVNNQALPHYRLLIDYLFARITVINFARKVAISIQF